VCLDNTKIWFRIKISSSLPRRLTLTQRKLTWQAISLIKESAWWSCTPWSLIDRISLWKHNWNRVSFRMDDYITWSPCLATVAER
jgi:hypothetical protein